MRNVFAVLSVLLILTIPVIGWFIFGEDQEQPPNIPLVYCHAQGGEVVGGKCVPHRTSRGAHIERVR